MDHSEVLYCQRIPFVIRQPLASGARAAHGSARPPLRPLAAPRFGSDGGAATRRTTENAGDENARTGRAADKSEGARPEKDGAMQEQHHPGLTVQISLTTTAPGRLKVLEFQLTDEDDPYFLCQLAISEDDYPLLKQEQHLLVDFQQFPHKFVELLEQVLRSSGSGEAPGSAGAAGGSPVRSVAGGFMATQFVAQLVLDAGRRWATLHIVETNSFKQMAHVSLDFTPGSDAAVKQYLAGLVQEGRQKVANATAQLQFASEQLGARANEAEVTVARLTVELERARLAASEKLAAAQMAAASEMAAAQERAARERETLRQELEARERAAESKHEQESRDLTLKNTHLTTTHSHLLSHNQTLEANLANVQSRLSDVERDYSSLKSDHDRMLSEKRAAEKARGEAERTLGDLRTRVAQLDEQVRGLTDELRRTGEALSGQEARRGKAEDALALQESKAQTLEETLMNTRADVNKGNDIIRRLQSELKESKEKHRLKNTITVQQEVLLEERAQLIQEYKDELEKAKTQADAGRAQADEGARELDETRAKLAAAQQTIQDNNNVIEWLHKQLNQTASLTFGGARGGPLPDFDRYARASPQAPAQSGPGRGDGYDAAAPASAARYLRSPRPAAPSADVGDAVADILAYRRRPTSPARPAFASSTALPPASDDGGRRSSSVSARFRAPPVAASDSSGEPAGRQTAADPDRTARTDLTDMSRPSFGASVSALSAPGKRYGISLKAGHGSAPTESVVSGRSLALKSNYF